MKNNKYKILVLSGLTETTSKLLKSTVSFAKVIGADIHFFHVKKPLDVVKRDSQLSTFRTINEQHTLVKNNLKKVINPIQETYNIEIDFTYTFGNIKNEIGEYISENKPDIIVLGKRKSKGLNLIGDNIAEYVLKEHKGFIMIADTKNTLISDQNLSIGILNQELSFIKKDFPSEILANTELPLKMFSFSKKLDTEGVKEGAKAVEYIFDYNDNTLQNLSKYLYKSNINLLLIDRKNNQKNDKQLDLKKVINKLDVPIFISGEK